MNTSLARRAAKVGLVGLVPALVIALTGCSTSSGEADGVTTVNFLNPHSGKYDALIAQFEDQNPGIKIEQQSVPYDELVSQVQARLSEQDDTIDVLAADPPRIANMVDQGFLTDESDALPEMQAAFTETGIESVSIDGVPYAYPMWTSDNFLFYNVDVLTRAGVPLPGATDADRLTFEQVVDYSRQIVESGAATYGFGIEQPDRYYALQPIAMGLGAGSGLEGEGNLTPAVATPEWQEFGQWYQDLFTEGLSPKGVDTSGMPDLLMSGEIGYLLANPVILNDVVDRLGDGWGVAPHPYFEGRDVVTPTDSWAFGISAFSKNQDAARTFVQFLTMNPEGIKTVTADLPFPPVATAGMSAYQDYLNDLAPEQTANLISVLEVDNAEHAVQRPQSIGFVQFETVMNKVFDDIRNGADVEEALTAAQADLERQLDRLK